MWPTPFAYGVVGKYLIATDAQEVCAFAADDQSTVWTFATRSPIVGVRQTYEAILVLEREGRLTWLQPASGEMLGQIDLTVPCTGLTATSAGRWAAVTFGGVVIGEGRAIVARHKLDKPMFAACAESQPVVAVATSEALVLLDQQQAIKTQRLPLSPTGLAWCPTGEWLVSTPKSLVLFASDLAGGESLASVDDMHLSGAVASPTGKFFAFRIDNDMVSILGREVGQIGTIRYRDRTLGELEFGPHPYLGIGIGLGDGNRISLLSDQVERTDPPAGRPRNRWLLGVSINANKVTQELSLKSSPRTPGKKSGCFGVLALLASIGIAVLLVTLWR